MQSHDRYSTASEIKRSPDEPITKLESTVGELEHSLRDRDAKMKSMQTALLKQGHKTDESRLDDRQLRDRFALLSQSITDWVLTYFKGLRSNSRMSAHTSNLFQKTVPSYSRLIQEPRTKYLVVRAVIAEIMMQAFANGDFFGSAAFSELQQEISTRGMALF